MFTRRQFLKTGLIGGAALLAVRAAYGPLANDPHPPADDYRFAFLGPAERGMFAVVAPVVLAGALPVEPGAHGQALRNVLRGLDIAMAGFLPPVQEELRQLFSLMLFPPTRRLVAGVASPWAEASPEEIAAFLARWQGSSVSLLQTAHQGLRQLCFAAWYGAPEAWPRIGYGGPPGLSA